MRIADEAQYKFDNCLRVIREEADDLPIFGIGHSMGALIHLIINARYAVVRSGNILLSFNNRPATDSIPFLSPIIAPGARALGPILNQVKAYP